MFLYEADDQPYDDPKEMYRVQCFHLILDQGIRSPSHWKVDLNNLKIMQNYLFFYFFLF